MSWDVPWHIIWQVSSCRFFFCYYYCFKFQDTCQLCPACVSVRCFRTPEDIIKTNCESIPLPMDTSTNVRFPLPQDAFTFFFLSGFCRWTGSAPNLRLYLYLSGGVAPWCTLQNFIRNTAGLRKPLFVCVSSSSALVGWQMLSLCSLDWICCALSNYELDNKNKAISARVYYLLWAHNMLYY